TRLPASYSTPKSPTLYARPSSPVKRSPPTIRSAYPHGCNPLVLPSFPTRRSSDLSFVVSALPDVDVFQSLHDIPLQCGFFSARHPECRIRSIYHHLKEEAGHSKARLS